MSSVFTAFAAFTLWLRPTSKLDSEGASATKAKAGPAPAKVRDSRGSRVLAPTSCRTWLTLPQKKQAAQKTGPVEYPDINTLRNAIPPHCFRPSLWISFAYLARDVLFIAALAYAALVYIPSIEGKPLRITAWMAYGFLQGLVCTGLWILAHECGHGAFSLHRRVNSIVGWAAHSFLLVPYFSWKFSHARHHRFTGHMEKDMAFVPRTEEDYHNRFFAKLGIDAELFEDTPIVALVRLLAHQLFGWQSYLIFNVTAGPKSLQEGKRWGPQSHFDPTSAVFRRSERPYIAISDLGLLITAAAIYYGVTVVGGSTMFFLYAVPYFWVHHWLGKRERNLSASGNES